LKKAHKRIGEVANSLGFGGDMFDDSTHIMNEMKKRELLFAPPSLTSTP
jgi:hypothetical protein